MGKKRIPKAQYDNLLYELCTQGKLRAQLVCSVIDGACQLPAYIRATHGFGKFSWMDENRQYASLSYETRASLSCLIHGTEKNRIPSIMLGGLKPSNALTDAERIDHRTTTNKRNDLHMACFHPNDTANCRSGMHFTARTMVHISLPLLPASLKLYASHALAIMSRVAIPWWCIECITHKLPNNYTLLLWHYDFLYCVPSDSRGGDIRRADIVAANARRPVPEALTFGPHCRCPHCKDPIRGGFVVCPLCNATLLYSASELRRRKRDYKSSKERGIWQGIPFFMDLENNDPALMVSSTGELLSNVSSGSTGAGVPATPLTGAVTASSSSGGSSGFTGAVTVMKRPASPIVKATYHRLDASFKEGVVSSGSTGAGHTLDDEADDELMINPNEGGGTSMLAAAFVAVAIGAGDHLEANEAIAAAAAVTPSERELEDARQAMTASRAAYFENLNSRHKRVTGDWQAMKRLARDQKKHEASWLESNEYRCKHLNRGGVPWLNGPGRLNSREIPHHTIVNLNSLPQMPPWVLKSTDLVALTINECYGTLDPLTNAFLDCRPVLDVIIANAHDLATLQADLCNGVVPGILTDYASQPQPKRRQTPNAPARVFPNEGALVNELARMLTFLHDWRKSHPGHA